MNREKYPNYFLMSCILYGIVFLAAFSYFIIPSLGFGFGYGEFLPIVIMMFFPMLLLIIYNLVPHIELLWGKEGLLRTITTIFIVIDFCIVLFLMFLLI